MKSSRSAVANFIHFLDSRLCSHVIYKCMKNDVTLWTNHDCFYTSKQNVEQVKRFYFESYKELLLQGDTLSMFFTANHVTHPRIVNNYLEAVKLERQKLCNDIEKEKLVMSQNILS